MRLAILGLGSAGIRHALNARRLGCSLVLFDPDTEVVREAARRLRSQRPVPLGNESGFSSAQLSERVTANAEVSIVGSAEAAVEAGVDAVIVASPTSSHSEQILRAAEAGLPVLTEKPVALDETQALELLERVGGRVPTMVGYNLRFCPPVMRAKKLVSENRLGRVIAASFWFGYDVRKWRPGRDWKTTYSSSAAAGGGILLEASHELDLCNWILGPIDSVRGAVVARSSLLDSDIHDVAAALLTTQRGAIVSLYLDEISPVYRRGFEIVGTKAVVRYDWTDGIFRLLRRSADRSRAQTSDALHEQQRLPPDVESSYVAELRHFLNCLTKGTHPSPGLREGVAAVGLAAAIERSARGGREVPVLFSAQDDRLASQHEESSEWE